MLACKLLVVAEDIGIGPVQEAGICPLSAADSVVVAVQTIKSIHGIIQIFL